MMKYFLLPLILFLTPTAYGAVSVESLIDQVDQYRGYPESPFEVTLLVHSKRPNKPVQKYKLAVKVKGEKSIVKFLAPARQKGRAILKEGNNMWFHIPRTRRVIRISPTQRLLGEASNGDVASTNFKNDYTAELVGEETVEKTLSYKLHLKATSRKINYATIDLWIDKSTGKPVKSNHYAISGKLLKVAFYKAFQNTESGEKLHKLLLVNPLRKGQYTWMIYNNYKQVNLPDQLFRKESLNRL